MGFLISLTGFRFSAGNFEVSSVRLMGLLGIVSLIWGSVVFYALWCWEMVTEFDFCPVVWCHRKIDAMQPRKMEDEKACWFGI